MIKLPTCGSINFSKQKKKKEREEEPLEVAPVVKLGNAVTCGLARVMIDDSRSFSTPREEN